MDKIRKESPNTAMAAPIVQSVGLKDGDFVKSLARGLLVIQSFDDEYQVQTLSEVAKRTGLSRATARRLLLTLNDLGYATLEGRSFALSPGILRLGYAYLSSLGVPEIAQPYLEALSEEVHESCSMTVLDGSDIVYVARASTKHLFSLTLSIGSRLPAFSTSMGRVLLADLDRAGVDAVLEASDLVARTDRSVTNVEHIYAELAIAKAQGWYLIDEELELGIRAVAASVRDLSGRVVAAINVSTTTARLSREDLIESVVPKLLDTANRLSAALQAR
jgi:IclR family pca regulon transcriptional regulator